MSEQEMVTIKVPELPHRTILVPIRGTHPLIVNRFPEKAKRQIQGTQAGAKKIKEPRDPEVDYQGAFHRLKDGEGYGFPVTGFKAATVSAARFYGSDVTMVALRQSMFFNGEEGKDGTPLVPLEASEPWMRQDMVRISRNTTDLRYRPQFDEWKGVLNVTYITSMLDEQSLLALIDAGGLAVGVGEWRPEKGGDFGRYQVDTTRPVEQV